MLYERDDVTGKADPELLTQTVAYGDANLPVLKVGNYDSIRLNT